MITIRRINDVQMRGKCSLRLSRTFTLAIIHFLSLLITQFGLPNLYSVYIDAENDDDERKDNRKGVHFMALNISVE